MPQPNYLNVELTPTVIRAQKWSFVYVWRNLVLRFLHLHAILWLAVPYEQMPTWRSWRPWVPSRFRPSHWRRGG